MGICISFRQIISATVYREDDITFNYPAEIHKPVISESDYSIVNAGIKLRLGDSTKFKSTQKADIAGDIYTNVFTYEEETVLKPEDSQIKSIQHHSHLMVECLGGAKYLIRGSKDWYDCASSEADGVTEIEITITNTSGAQHIL